MSSLQDRARRGTVVAIAAALAFVVAGCGGADGSEDSAASDGVLTVGITPGYPPFEYYSKQHKLIGADVDLSRALAERLDMTASFKNAAFTSIIPGIAGGRYSVGISGFSDTKEREQAVTFVNYYRAGTALLVKKGNPEHLQLDSSVCGKTIAVVTGSSEVETILPLLHTICEKAGKSDVVPLTLPDVANPPIAVRNNRAAGALIDGASGAYIARTDKNALQLAPGPQLLVAPFGIAVAKDSPLIAKIKTALQSMIDDGSYRRLMAKWGLASPGSLLKRVTVNGAPD